MPVQPLVQPSTKKAPPPPRQSIEEYKPQSEITEIVRAAGEQLSGARVQEYQPEPLHPLQTNEPDPVLEEAAKRKRMEELRNELQKVRREEKQKTESIKQQETEEQKQEKLKQANAAPPAEAKGKDLKTMMRNMVPGMIKRKQTGIENKVNTVTQ